MKKKNIMVFTAARSDFGIMKNTIIRLNQMNKFNFFLVIGSAHTSKAFGNTIKEINKIKIKNKIKLNFDYSKNSQIKDVTKNFTNTMIGTQKIFDKKRFDCCLIMGDRYEMIAVAIVCLNNNVPIAHICGGSETYGSIDNEYRNSISQMANFHFVETNHHKKRLKNMGINRDIYVVGAPALENLKFHRQNFNKIQKQNLPNFNLKKKLVVSCFHPETTTNLKNNLKNLNSLKSLHCFRLATKSVCSLSDIVLVKLCVKISGSSSTSVLNIPNGSLSRISSIVSISLTSSSKPNISYSFKFKHFS